MNFSYMVYWVSFVVQTRQDIEKKISTHIKVFPIKHLAFKIFIFSLSQICIFCQIFKKIHVLSFLLMPVLCLINGTQSYFHF